LTAPARIRIIRRPNSTPERMMHLRRLAVVPFALLAFPALAHAGPIEFTYAAYGGVSLPPGAVPWYSPGDVTFSLTPEGDVRWPATGGSLELGAVQFGRSPGPLAPDTYTTSLGFNVSVVVTDAATGRHAVLALVGDALDDWIRRPFDGLWLNDFHRLEFDDPFGSNAALGRAVIGDARYELSVRPENDNTVGVYTLSATAVTPEPGTFALAAFGLAPLGLRRLRWS
jgi:hypothetical protein